MSGEFVWAALSMQDNNDVCVPRVLDCSDSQVSLLGDAAFPIDTVLTSSYPISILEYERVAKGSNPLVTAEAESDRRREDEGIMNNVDRVPDAAEANTEDTGRADRLTRREDEPFTGSHETSHSGHSDGLSMTGSARPSDRRETDATRDDITENETQAKVSGQKDGPCEPCGELSSVKLTETAVKLTEIAVKLTEIPVKLTEIAVKLTETPVKLTEIPFKFTKTSVQRNLSL